MRIKFLIYSILCVSLFAACKKKTGDTVDLTANETAAKQEVVNNYAQIVYLSYLDSYNTAKIFETKTQAFLAAPSQAGLDDLKTAWLHMRVPYLQTEAYRFYGGPIDGAVPNVEGFVNGWPLDESYVDYIATDANTGIINSTEKKYETISQTLIQNSNEDGSETSISSGYHAIEFLLWGQDLSTTGPGTRPFTDYTTFANAVRRKTYLKEATALLVNHLGLLLDQWKPKGTYRTLFVSQNPQVSLELILKGIGILTAGELPYERIEVALDNQDQEDEHSCFSDNTHNDIRYDVLGVENVFYGRYKAVDGTVFDGKGLDELVKSKDLTVYNTSIGRFADTKAKADAIQAPFDREIIGNKDVDAGPKRVKATVDAIVKEKEAIIDMAKLFGISLILE